MSLLLNYPSKLVNHALKCVSVARTLDFKIEEEVMETHSRVTLTNGDVTLKGSGAICLYLINLKNKLDVRDQSRVVQWISFVDSEISPYIAGSKHLARSLLYLDKWLSEEKFISCRKFSPFDIIVGFPLLTLPQKFISPYSHLASWLDLVKSETKPHSGSLKSSVKAQSPRVKGETNKPKCQKSNEVKGKSTPRKLKILCIHGYRQNAKSFKEKLGSFRKLIGKQADVEFITAPHHIPSNDPEEQNQYGWWFSQPCKTFDAHETSSCDLGFSESLSSVEEALTKGIDGCSYDGVLAFSQGAALAAHLCVLKQLGQLKSDFKFCILVAGFVSRTLQHQEIFETMLSAGVRISFPTLHVFGDTDKVIEKNMSENLLQFCENPEIIRHPGGHFVPASGEHKKGFNVFLDKMQGLYC